MTELCQLEGCARKWQLAYFGLKVDYYGHIFKISTSNLFCPSFTLEVNRTQNDYFSPRKKQKMAIFAFFYSVRHFGYYQYFSMISFASVRGLNS